MKHRLEKTINYYSNNDPEEVVMQKERLRIINEFISGLSGIDKRIAELRFQGKSSPEEIGRELNIDLESVNLALSILSKDIMDILKQEEDESNGKDQETRIIYREKRKENILELKRKIITLLDHSNKAGYMQQTPIKEFIASIIAAVKAKDYGRFVELFFTKPGTLVRTAEMADVWRGFRRVWREKNPGRINLTPSDINQAGVSFLIEDEINSRLETMASYELFRL